MLGMANLEYLFGATSASKALLDLPIVGKIRPNFTSVLARQNSIGNSRWDGQTEVAQKRAIEICHSKHNDRRPERQLVGLPWAADSCPWVGKLRTMWLGGGCFALHLINTRAVGKLFCGAGRGSASAGFGDCYKPVKGPKSPNLLRLVPP
jgi:hypothetical protein